MTDTHDLGPLLEDAAYDCLSELAGVDTHDVNLRDHPEAWAAIEAFAAKVRAAERARCAKVCANMAADAWREAQANPFMSDARDRYVARREALRTAETEIRLGPVDNQGKT